MSNLETTYMGLRLKNPIIIASSGLTSKLDSINKLEKNDAAGIVLKSIFEEQILSEAASIGKVGGSSSIHAQADDYINYYVKQNTLGNYLKLIEDCKNEIKIPVIASVNCTSAKAWAGFAKSIMNAGADALELNIYILPFDEKIKGEDIENRYFDIIHQISREISIPIAVKIGYHFSSLANTIVRLSKTKISGLVLFNRFMNLDIDINSMEVKSSDIFSTPDEIFRSLRWIGLLYDNVSCDLAATTGIHDGYGIVKAILAGAVCVEIATAIYKNGPQYITKMLDQINGWMQKHGYESINDFRGKSSDTQVKNPQVFERAQFMKYFSDYQQ
jgi:dihydroorotate dehydrogenase (fumarate)